VLVSGGRGATGKTIEHDSPTQAMVASTGREDIQAVSSPLSTKPTR
jgi:hypothetical protein